MLSGISVLELGEGIATAYCGRLLADLGARVLTLEPPGGSRLRSDGPFPGDLPNPAYGGLFAYLNSGKESVTLDSNSEDGFALLERLAAHADVLIDESSGPAVEGVRHRYERLHSVNPGLLFTSLSPFGLSGPRRCWLATPLTLFALSSRMRLHGDPDRHPLQYAPDAVPFQAGATAAAATVTALAGRHDGHGRLIEVSMLESLIANVDVITILTSFTGLLNPRGIYQPTTYPCKDGYIILAFQDRSLTGIKEAIGDSALLSDPRFADRASVVKHQDAFDALVLPWLLERTRADLFELLQAHHVMCAPVFDFVDVLADPHLRARGFLRTFADPVLGPVTVPGSVFGPSSEALAHSAAAQPGADNVPVYQDLLGLSPTAMSRLHARGVL